MQDTKEDIVNNGSESKEYTDKEMLLAAQSAYLNITEDDIWEYKKINPDGYPTLQ